MRLVKSLSILSLIALSVSCTHKETVTWNIAPNPILTEWAKDVNPVLPWKEYPRPNMVRSEWMNLNGIWNYAITPKGKRPERWDGSILVPYPLESALSGVKKKISEKENLWYKKTLNIPKGWDNKHILLNFEACDWETTVWFDGKELGTHKGGYDPFTFDITESISKSELHELIVCVWDPTDKGTQPRGKQVSSPEGIWYTSTSGIWQTVWLEPVNESYISSFKTTTNIDDGTVVIKTDVKNAIDGTLSIKIKKNGKTAAEAEGKVGEALTLQIKNPVLWTPDKPVLYDISIELKYKNKTTDNIESYTGLRKVSIGKTSDGFTRMLLNNEFIYQNGPLDQGFWPDGLYTPPTEEAMVFDLNETKRMGFNMLRKHVKVENRLFYYWCDKLGILVWQDMPSGDKYISGDMPDISKSKESSDQFELELKRMIDTKYNNPSIIMWVPFNEGWGQFETARITKLISDYDNTRLVNSTSGWTDRGTGDINDIHHYPEPVVQSAEENRAIVLGEFGGLGLPLEGHTWEQKNWGYRTMTDTLQLLSRYESYYDLVYKFVKDAGLSATIYTQTTDVETETNGLLTYDRKVNKMGVENVFKANNNIVPPSLSTAQRIFINEFSAELKNYRLSGKIYYTTDGSEPTIKSHQYTGPIKISETTTIKAFTKWDDAESRVISYLIEKKEALPPTIPERTRAGLKAYIYDGNFSVLPAFSSLKPVLIKSISDVSHKIAGRDSLFAAVFEGYLLIPTDGVYGFYISSDDGSKMIIDSTDPVNNDGIHGMKEEGRSYPLAQGYHKLRIEYFQRLGGIGLEFLVEAPGLEKTAVPKEWLFY